MLGAEKIVVRRKPRTLDWACTKRKAAPFPLPIQQVVAWSCEQELSQSQAYKLLWGLRRQQVEKEQPTLPWPRIHSLGIVPTLGENDKQKDLLTALLSLLISPAQEEPTAAWSSQLAVVKGKKIAPRRNT